LETLEWNDKPTVNVLCLGHTFKVDRVLDEIKLDANLTLSLVLDSTKIFLEQSETTTKDLHRSLKLLDELCKTGKFETFFEKASEGHDIVLNF
jgi:hypothetical protein